MPLVVHVINRIMVLVYTLFTWSILFGPRMDFITLWRHLVCHGWAFLHVLLCRLVWRIKMLVECWLNIHGFYLPAFKRTSRRFFLSSIWRRYGIQSGLFIYAVWFFQLEWIIILVKILNEKFCFITGTKNECWSCNQKLASCFGLLNQLAKIDGWPDWWIGY